MKHYETHLARAAHFILRMGLPMTFSILLYTCFYIYTQAPDGGVMQSFHETVAQLLSHAVASLALLIVAAAIPKAKPFG